MKIIINAEVKEETIQAVVDQITQKFLNQGYAKEYLVTKEELIEKIQNGVDINLDELFSPMMPMVINFAMNFVDLKKQQN